jgi:DNA-binding NarL/FixJ family response regulator
MRVVIADDVMLVREGIAHVLGEAGIEVVAQASDAESLMREVIARQPDIAIVDIRMPPTHTDEGLGAAKQIRADHPGIGVLVLSQYIEPSYAMRLIEDQPERVGYILKERVFDGAILVDAVRRIADGDTVIDPTIVSRMIGRQRREGPLASLTVREREVLSLVAEGLSNRAIATRVFLSERTVEAHVTQIFQKLRLNDSADQHRRVLAVLAYLRA